MKMVSFCVLLIILPFVRSSDEDHQSKTLSMDKDNSIYQAEVISDQKLLIEITTHGFLLWASMGFFMPIGILTIRMSNTCHDDCGRRRIILFQIHAISQMVAAVLATAGAVMSFKNFNNAFNNNHQRIGVALYAIVWLQVLTGFIRPHRGSKRRGVWFVVHWMVGTAMSLMGVFSIFSGLQAYHEKTSKKITVWTSLFTAQICFICFIYLFQDKWPHIQKQTNHHLSLPSKQNQKDHSMPMEEI